MKPFPEKALRNARMTRRLRRGGHGPGIEGTRKLVPCDLRIDSNQNRTADVLSFPGPMRWGAATWPTITRLWPQKQEQWGGRRDRRFCWAWRGFDPGIFRPSQASVGDVVWLPSGLNHEYVLYQVEEPIKATEESSTLMVSVFVTRSVLLLNCLTPVSRLTGKVAASTQMRTLTPKRVFQEPVRDIGKYNRDGPEDS